MVYEDVKELHRQYKAKVNNLIKSLHSGNLSPIKTTTTEIEIQVIQQFIKDLQSIIQKEIDYYS